MGTTNQPDLRKDIAPMVRQIQDALARHNDHGPANDAVRSALGCAAEAHQGRKEHEPDKRSHKRGMARSPQSAP